MLSIPGPILRFLGAIEAFNEVFLNLENNHLGSFFSPKNGPKKALSNRIDALFTTVVMSFWNGPTIPYKILETFLCFSSFISQQVKRSNNIININWMCQLPYKLPKDIILRILGNENIYGNLITECRHSLVPRLPSKNNKKSHWLQVSANKLLGDLIR